ncbi:MAG: Gmad2 immunoglobulin-like domain-containing protein [Anaerolineae bacterium]
MIVYHGFLMQAPERSGAVILILALTAGCGLFSPSAVTPSPTPTASPVPGAADGPPEAILLLEPGPASRVTSPVRVAGIADPTFEQNLVVQILLPDGSEVALSPTTIQAELGQRGHFEVEIPFSIADTQNAFIQAYDQSARDGGTIHLATVGVILIPSGPDEIVPVEEHAEVIRRSRDASEQAPGRDPAGRRAPRSHSDT